MIVLIVEPGKKPRAAEIEQTLEAMQAVVGGYIQAIYPFDEPIALVCHEEGKLLNLPLNRALYCPDTADYYDIIAGNFFLCAAPPDSDHFESLSKEQIAFYQQRFRHPEQFLNLGGSILRIPVEEAI
jgi:hypothetical protein